MKLKLAGTLALLLGGSVWLSADPIPVSPTGTWLEQYEIMGGSGESFANDYVAAQDGTILISGYYENTDKYQVFLNGTLVLTTSNVTGPAVDYGDTYGTYTDPSDATYWSGLFSTGSFDVTTGDVISIKDIGPLFADSTYCGYDAQVGLEALAPEPAALGSLGLSMVAAALWFRRRRTRVS